VRKIEVEAEVLPAGEPAVHHRHVRVAELDEGAGRERAAHAGRAIHDDLRVLVRNDVLDAALEVGPREVPCPRNEPVGDLLGLPDVEQLGPLAPGAASMNLFGGRHRYGGPNLTEQVAEVSHVPTLQ
jgi:hypothetical protein